jgi:hypothetical protein
MKMKKTMALIRGSKEETYSAFRARIMKYAVQLSGDKSNLGVRLVITSEPPPFFSIIPFNKKKAALVSVYRTDSANPFDKDTLKFSGIYQVDEAVPVAYEKSWSDGETTPGICLMTLFRRKNELATETFLDRWHNSHTPLSLRIHPLWNYSRNVVMSSEAGSDFFEGLVEEHMRTDAELLNPFRFFGNPLVIVARMISVLKDTKSFIDYPSMETYMARETVVKSILAQ